MKAKLGSLSWSGDFIFFFFSTWFTDFSKGSHFPESCYLFSGSFHFLDYPFRMPYIPVWLWIQLTTHNKIWKHKYWEGFFLFVNFFALRFGTTLVCFLENKKYYTHQVFHFKTRNFKMKILILEKYVKKNKSLKLDNCVIKKIYFQCNCIFFMKYNKILEVLGRNLFHSVDDQTAACD